MTTMQVRYVKKSDQYHCRVLTSSGGSRMMARGTLIIPETEWNDVLVTFECGGAEVLPEVER